MKLEEWRNEQGYSYRELAIKFGFTLNLVYRLCKDSPDKISLHDAQIVIKGTGGVVGISDLLGGAGGGGGTARKQVLGGD